jgi:hypothetical protein
MCSNPHSSTWGGGGSRPLSFLQQLWVNVNIFPELSNEMPIHRAANDETLIYSKPLTRMTTTACNVLSSFEHLLQFPADLNKLTKNGILDPYRTQLSLWIPTCLNQVPLLNWQQHKCHFQHLCLKYKKWELSNLHTSTLINLTSYIHVAYLATHAILITFKNTLLPWTKTPLPIVCHSREAHFH